MVLTVQVAGRRLYRVFALATAALALAIRPPTTALACGMPLAARIPAEQALISFAGGREEIVTSVQLQSDRPGAAVVFPMPGVPEPYRMVENRTVYVTGTPAPGGGAGTRISAGAVLGVALALVASALALGIAFGLRRRMDRIAGPTPDENNDE